MKHEFSFVCLSVCCGCGVVIALGGIEPNLGVPISLPNGAHLGKGALASLFFLGTPPWSVMTGKGGWG